MKVKRLHLKARDVHYAAIRGFLNHYCSHTPWGRKALGFLRSRDLVKLMELANEVDESLRCSPIVDWFGHSCEASAIGEFRLRNQFVALITKYPYEQDQLPGDPDLVALESLRRDEHRNRRLNTIFRAYRVRGKWRHPLHPYVADVVWRVLKDEPDMMSIYAQCDFSGGASVGTKGEITHFGAKLTDGIAVTPACADHFINSMLHNKQLVSYFAGDHEDANDPLSTALWAMEAARRELKIVDNNIIGCVTKNSKSSRTIAKEPEGNSFVQKGVDCEMRALLLHELNLDLSNQDINGLMAREGSIHDCDPYVTVDVKSASNGVFVQLARYLSPPAWFALWDEIRSPSGQWPDGTARRYELFSSMGNGFTFPLETLIFAAVCIAAYRYCGARPDFRVYGDDIVVRQSVALVVIELLHSFGFRTNNEKTFVHGKFRESCGANWYEGASVTPAYWRNHVTTRDELHAIHNAFQFYPEVQDILRGFDPECPFVVPNEDRYGWVTNQAFRVDQGIWMGHSNVIWRRDTRSWRFPLLISTAREDNDFGLALPGKGHKDLRWLGNLRAMRGSNPFLKRRAVRWYPQPATPDSKLECSQARQYGRVSWHWDASALHTLQLLRKGGMSQHRCRETMDRWYQPSGGTV